LPPVSSALSRISALYLGLLGFAFLFASDDLLPRLIPGFPTDAAWFGQLLAAAWLGAAALNWNGRATLLGGIYGRPQVTLNLMIFMVGALSMLRANAPSLALWSFTVPMSVLGLAYAAVFVRGPFDRLAPPTAGP
jgi:hypothetical protein